MGSQTEAAVMSMGEPSPADLQDIAAQLLVCPMEARHLDAVTELEQLCFASPWSRGMFEDDVVRNPLARYLLLLDKAEPNRAVAYAGYWKILDEGHITNVAVHPAWRRRGVATYLLGLLIEMAAAEGAMAMTLEVRPSNEAAQSLYRKLGFVVEGRRPHYYEDNGEDALIMWRRGDKGETE